MTVSTDSTEDSTKAPQAPSGISDPVLDDEHQFEWEDMQGNPIKFKQSGISDRALDDEHQFEWEDLQGNPINVKQSGREGLNAEAEQMKAAATLQMMKLREEQADKEEAD